MRKTLSLFSKRKLEKKQGRKEQGLTRSHEFTKGGKERVRQLKIPLSKSPTQKKCERRFPNLRSLFNPPLVERMGPNNGFVGRSTGLLKQFRHGGRVDSQNRGCLGLPASKKNQKIASDVSTPASRCYVFHLRRRGAVFHAGCRGGEEHGDRACARGLRGAKIRRGP